METTIEFKVEKNDFICESNREIRAIIGRFLYDNLAEKYDEISGRNGWFRINKGIYFRTVKDDNKQKEFFQLAVQENKFDNKYLLRHSMSILSKIVSEHVKDAPESWNSGNGETLDIFGKGQSTNLRYIQLEV